jgi:hypothetical protein
MGFNSVFKGLKDIESLGLDFCLARQQLQPVPKHLLSTHHRNLISVVLVAIVLRTDDFC